MTDVEIRPAGADELAPGIVSYPTHLTIDRELSFNEWKSLVETLDHVNERGAWALGDALEHGERFADEYPDGFEAVTTSSRHRRECKQTSRTFPPGERSDRLTWFHHLVLVVVKDHRTRLQWLSSAERGGWSARELADRLKHGRQIGTRPAALQLRPVGDVVERFEARARDHNVSAREMALEVLHLASMLEHPISSLRDLVQVEGAGLLEDEAAA